MIENKNIWAVSYYSLSIGNSEFHKPISQIIDERRIQELNIMAILFLCDCKQD